MPFPPSFAIGQIFTRSHALAEFEVFYSRTVAESISFRPTVEQVAQDLAALLVVCFSRSVAVMCD